MSGPDEEFDAPPGSTRLQSAAWDFVEAAFRWLSDHNGSHLMPAELAEAAVAACQVQRVTLLAVALAVPGTTEASAVAFVADAVRGLTNTIIETVLEIQRNPDRFERGGTGTGQIVQ